MIHAHICDSNWFNTGKIINQCTHHVYSAPTMGPVKACMIHTIISNINHLSSKNGKDDN